MNLGWRKNKGEDEPAAKVEPVVVQLDTDELQRMSAVFAAPRWLRDLGVASWFLVGVGFLLLALVLLLGATAEITMPVLTAFIIASVASPIVTKLQKRRIDAPGAP